MIWKRADRVGRTLPAAGYIWLPAYRFEANRAAWGLLELLGNPLQVPLGLLRVIADHLEKTLPQRVLRLQTKEEMHVLEVGIDLLQAAKNAIVSRVGVIAAWLRQTIQHRRAVLTHRLCGTHADGRRLSDAPTPNQTHYLVQGKDSS